MHYSLDFQAVTQNASLLMHGLVITIELTAAANVIGLVCGFLLALLVLSRHPIVRLPASTFIEFFRCTPALVQLIWFFYCVPMLFGVYFGQIIMGILALGLNLTAFNAEAYRASIQAVPREQIDAGIALGLNPAKRILYIVLPSAFRASIPVLITNGITIFQQSSLVALVAVQDLMYDGRLIANQTYRPIEVFTAVALIYFAISYPIAQVVEYLERRWDLAIQ